MIACLDACVLYPTVMRALLLGVAAEGLYRPVWSGRISGEWVRAAARAGAAAEAQAEAELATLRAAWPEAEIEGGETADLWLPDPNDAHVLATARAAGADSIVTLNLRDFPRRATASLGIAAIHPDPFLLRLMEDAPEAVAAVAEAVRARTEADLGAPIEIRALFKRAGLPRLGKRLAA
ncbi:PIN domain-containing protein [Rhodobacterales bacterium HKCCE3408]|nr:PIN domain-containing protein [Rhodobacterales bacterium HKCCE3408]